MKVDILKPHLCCACGESKICRVIATLNLKAPIPGTGWSCVVCGLPADGAIAVICDDCEADPNVEIRWAVVGSLCVSDARIPIEELTGSHPHNARYHPELWAAELN